MTVVYNYSSCLVVLECCRCHIDFGLPEEMHNKARKDPSIWFYCPAGHHQHFPAGKSDEAKLREAEAREVALRDQLHAAEADAEKTRGVLLRDRQRFANGVCPCCNRTFQNVLNHMRGEHPDYDVTKVEAQKYACSCGRSFETFAGLRRHQASGRKNTQSWYSKPWTDPSLSDYSRHLTRV